MDILVNKRKGEMEKEADIKEWQVNLYIMLDEWKDKREV